MSKTSELLFEYMRDAIYDYANASLDVEALEEEYRTLGQGMVFFFRLLNEQRDFAKALARGDLSVNIPSRENELAAPLKALHASLRHMAWQSQQVAKGDYNQRVDFMGEFAESFNAMTEQLDTRQRALEREIEVSNKKTRALEQSANMLANITANIPQMIIVLAEGSGEVLYCNDAARTELEQGGFLLKEISGLMREMQSGDLNESSAEFCVADGDTARHFSASYYTLQWGGAGAKAFVAEDISADKEMERHARRDDLTGLYNRFFGMSRFHDLLGEGKPFTLCFVDLDYLKYVNDNFGHAEGDKYLVGVADLLRTFSAESIVCRVGGDEFMLLNPGFTMQRTKARMEELCARLRERGTAREKSYACSMSYGAVEVGADNALPARDILSLADERMYTFKRKQKKKYAVQGTNLKEMSAR